MVQTGGVGLEAFAGFDFPFDFPLSTGSDSHCTFEPVRLVEGKERKAQQTFSHLLLKPPAEGIICSSSEVGLCYLSFMCGV